MNRDDNISIDKVVKSHTNQNGIQTVWALKTKQNQHP